MIAIKTLIARWIASRLAGRARVLRRSLRDISGANAPQIRVLEERSRGLRLYTAWVRKEKAISIREAPERWQLPQITVGAFDDNMRAAA
jgi:hypothetical protein